MIESTFADFVHFVARYLTVIRDMFRSPTTFMNKLNAEGEKKYLDADVFLLLTLIGFTYSYLSLMDVQLTVGVLEYAAFFQKTAQNIASTSFWEKTLYIIPVTLVFYLCIWLIKIVLGVRDNIYMRFVKYYAGVSLLLWLIIAHAYTVVGYFSNRVKDISVYYQIYLYGTYLVPAILLFLAIRPYFRANRKMWIRYFFVSVCIVFSADVADKSLFFVYNVMNKESPNLVVMKGSIKFDPDKEFSYGLVSPFLIADASKTPQMVKFDLYFYNSSNQTYVIPKNDSLFLGIMNSADAARLSISEKQIELLESAKLLDSVAFYISSSEDKGNRLTTLKPGELKRITFFKQWTPRLQADILATSDLQGSRGYLSLSNTEICSIRNFGPN